MHKLLSDLFSETGRSDYKGLSKVRIGKIELYQKDSDSHLMISIDSNVEEENDLAIFVRTLSYKTNCKVEVKFVCIEEEMSAYLDCNVKRIAETMVSDILFDNPDLYLQVITTSFYESEDRLIIKTDEINRLDIYEGLMNTFIEKVFEYLEDRTGANYRNRYELVYVEKNDPGYRIDDKDDEDIVTQEEFQTMIASQEQERDSATTKEEKKVDKDSWAYKAKEQKKQFSVMGGKNVYFNRIGNIKEVICGKVQKNVPTVFIRDLEQTDLVNIVGRIKFTEDGLRLSKSGSCVVAPFTVMDSTGGISCIAFIKPEEADDFEKTFRKGGYAGFQGQVQRNNSELSLKVTGVFPATPPEGKRDNASRKRVELHAHTKMSDKDAVIAPSDLMKRAAQYGHSACAVTDHGTVQAFPEVYETVSKLKVGDSDKPFKAILGCEGYLVEDGPTCFYGLPLDATEGKAVGTIVSISIKTSGKDSCVDRIEAIAASKFRLVNYLAPKLDEEGEESEAAKIFSQKDIDKDLWSISELPENLQNLSGDSSSHDNSSLEGLLLNIDKRDISTPVSEDKEIVPTTIVYEHVADFYCEVDDVIYGGSGEPSDSYFKVGVLLEFIGDSYLCGENTFETLAFLRRAGFGVNIEDHKYYRHKFLQPVADANEIKRLFYKLEDYNNHEATTKLDCMLCDYYSYDDKTREDLINSSYEAASIVTKCLIDQNTVDPYRINQTCGHFELDGILSKKAFSYHIILLARNNLALYNLYHLISESHVNYFYMRPRIPRSVLKYYGSSIIVGAACERGEIYRNLLDAYLKEKKNSDAALSMLFENKDFARKITMYDYLEIQPRCNNDFMTRQSYPDYGDITINSTDIQELNVLLTRIADHFMLPCCGTTDSHFLDEEDGKFRKYMLMEMGFNDAQKQPDLYFRTTDEMLSEFSYLGADKAMEVVVDNTNMIADKVEHGLKPFPDGTYPPIIATAASDVRDICWTKANRLYRFNGELNDVVYARLEKELNSIIGNGFAIMYYIAYRLVKKSNNDGYIVGSRGSVGSSLVATMCGISEVNPLPPHYRCPKCNYTEFDYSGNYGSGYDLPEKNCPHCDVSMIKDGQDIPFETFLGFFGDKQPDIDLNFSSDYQPRAHKYVEYLFGKSHTFRAGTIGTYQDKNAYGIIRKIGEMTGTTYSNAMIDFLSEGIIGVKRTTSQHPGGIVVVPKEMDVYEFTPIQYPANKISSGIITTHFDFHAMHDTILKLDILGHADPTVLRMLSELTGVDVTSIPIPDPKVMSLLETTEALGFDISATDAGSATLGLSELGTNMARGMIKEAHPTHFFDLVQLMGLSHGTDVWAGNAQDLIREGKCDLNTCIGCRDSIMTRLIYWGLPNKDSFDIMERVRKGKGLTPEQEQLMRDNNVPDWYIGSCKKIKYMFPKAHAAAYSISTLRVAWFKVYYPEEYYCAFLSIRGEEFVADRMCQGLEELINRRKQLSEIMRTDKNPKIKSEFYLCEIIEEMYARGIEFDSISLDRSDSTSFVKVSKGRILPPLCAIDSISASMATEIVRARQEKPFANREDLMKRSGIGKSALARLVDYGLCEDLPETSQITIFDFMG